MVVWMRGVGVIVMLQCLADLVIELVLCCFVFFLSASQYRLI